MNSNNINCKTLQRTIDSETYRTDTSTLLAYDENNKIFLFRALNSNYFVQYDNEESIEVLDTMIAEEMWNNMPVKNVLNVVAAFPKYHGGIGIDTYTNFYDDI